MAFCNMCGTQIPDGTITCAACASRIPTAGAPVATAAPTQGMSDNVAGMLAYFVIPAVIFLVMEPYNRNRFIRFHSLQSLFLAVAWIVLWIALNIFVHIPVLGWLSFFLIWPLVGLAGFILWIVLLLKANQGKMYKLPMIGDMAEKQANAM